MNDDPHPSPISDGLSDVNRSAFLFPLPKTTMAFTGERFVSGLDGQIKHEHYHRYLFAARYCVGKDVLDVASGEGYGSTLLSQVAKQVIGVDIDQASVDYANRTYLSNSVSFKQGDAVDLPIATASVDVVVSFETIEHFADHARFIAEVARVLRPGGLLVISSPNKSVYDLQSAQPNPFHVNELDRDEFVAVLRARFDHIALSEQRALNGSIILQTDRPEIPAIETFEADDGLLFTRQPGLSGIEYFIALASTAPLPRPRGSFLHNKAHILGLHAALEQLSSSAKALRLDLTAKTGQIEEAEAQVRHFQSLIEESNDRFARQGEELQAVREHFARQGEELQAVREHLARRNEELQAAQEHLRQVFASTSWALSRPVRWIGGLRRGSSGRAALAVPRVAWWIVTFQLGARLREQRQVRSLYEAGGFDRGYYLHAYPDVAASGMDPALHYLRIGAAEERNPSAEFSTSAYRSRHPELSLDANPLLDAILTSRFADGRISRPHASGLLPLNTASAFAAELLARSAGSPGDFSALVYHEHDDPEVALIVDARVMTPAVERSLRVICAEDQTLPGELFVLVRTGSDFALAGARRVVVEQRPALDYVASVLIQSRARVVVLVDGETAIEEAAVAAGLATFSEAGDVAIVCALRYMESGVIVDAGLHLDPDGSLHARGAGLPAGHYEVASLAPVDAFTPDFFAFDKAAWQAVDGINAEFENQAYAAVDLSMRLRAAGKKILCQPLMRAQTGKAVASSFEAAADIDRLLGAWGGVIEQTKRHPQPRALFVDQFTPTPDRDAGSNVLWWYMRIFQDLGYRVTFLPARDLTPAGAYTDDMRRQGIECVSLPAATTAERYLRENAGVFPVVLLYRAPFAHVYIDLIRRYTPKTQIILNTVDLHFLREEREAALLGSTKSIKSARTTKRLELAAIRKVDCTIVLSRAEHEILQDLVPEAYKQFIPLTQPVPGREAPFESRENVVFVGGFAHKPNVDAVHYLVREIWPLVRRELPDVGLIVVGSSVPDEVLSLGDAAAGVEIRGFVPDLASLLRDCRLTVAPLRYGAGMKGKVVNSLAHGVPCVATTMAVEGTGLVDGRDILVADDPSSYARAIVSAYTEAELWVHLSDNGVAFAEENFSIGAVTATVRDMLRTLGLPARV